MQRSREIHTTDGRRTARRIPFDFGRLRSALLVVVAGLIVGTQIFKPTKRVIEAIVGVVLLAVMWNFSTLAAVWFVAVMYPFPFAISLGNSNFVLVLLIFIIYLIRVSSGKMTITFDRRIRLPVVLLMLAYLASFLNVDPTSRLLRFGLVNTGNFFAAVVFMFMIVNMVDDEDKLRQTVRFMLVGATLVIAFTIIEILFPGRTIIPNWLYTRHKTALIMKGLRMGGPFHDFELVAEFFAMNAIIMFFMMIRTRRLLHRSVFASLLVVDMMMMFSTITRGAFISLGIGMVYLLFLSRKELDIVRFVSIVGAVALMIFVIEFFVARYTTSGSLFDRLFTTTFERGVVPYNRVAAWSGAIERGMQHPLLGNGPGWDFERGLSVGLWPHNVYLFYFNITGIFGLFAFLFLLYRLGRMSLGGIHASLANSPFPEALMKILHVCFVMFVIDQIKIEYLRNDRYVFFVWMFFGLIIATSNVIEKQRAAAEAAAALASAANAGAPPAAAPPGRTNGGPPV